MWIRVTSAQLQNFVRQNHERSTPSAPTVSLVWSTPKIISITSNSGTCTGPLPRPSALVTAPRPMKSTAMTMPKGMESLGSLSRREGVRKRTATCEASRPSARSRARPSASSATRISTAGRRRRVSLTLGPLCRSGMRKPDAISSRLSSNESPARTPSSSAEIGVGTRRGQGFR